MFKNCDCSNSACNFNMNNMERNEMPFMANQGLGMNMGMDMHNCMEGHMHKPVCCPVQERCVHKTIVHEVPQE